MSGETSFFSGFSSSIETLILTIILIVLVTLLLAFIVKSLGFVKRLIEFFKKDDAKNIAIGGAILTIAIGIFFGNIAFFITLALIIAMLYFEYKKSSSSLLNEPSSKSGFWSSVSQSIPSVSQSLKKLKNDVKLDNQERKLKSKEIQEIKMAERMQSRASQTIQSKSTSSGSFNKSNKEQPKKQKWVVMIKMGKGSHTWIKGQTYDDYNRAQFEAKSKNKQPGTEARVEPA